MRRGRSRNAKEEGRRMLVVQKTTKIIDAPPPLSPIDVVLPPSSSPSPSSDEGPPEIRTCDADAEEDAISVESSSRTSGGGESEKRSWDRPYAAPPVVDQNTVLAVGCFVFCLAYLWPPLILLLAYIASKLIPYSFRENDSAVARRVLYTQFCQQERQDDLPERFRNIRNYVNLEESYWTNERGMLLCTTIMTPRNKAVTGVVCFCHGYTDHASFAKRIEFQRLCDAGLAFVAIEYEGHGRSDGALGLIGNFEELVRDVSAYFSHVTAARFPNHPAFLMGESMGGAVAYCVYNRIPTIFRGVVFVCPMCKISDEMLPPQYVIDFVRWIVGPSAGTGSTTTSLLGYLPIAPSKNDLKDLTHRIKEKGLLSSRCPLLFDRNPRLATARELIDVTQRISGSLAEFDAPFLVLHGKEDRVTDPALSLALYNESKSTDKSIRLYDGMWHALTFGESDENIDRVFGDVTRWILARL